MSAAARAVTITEELSRAAESGDVEALERLLPRVADLNARNRHGMTVLMRAASCGNAQGVRVLLEHGADPNLTRNDKFTALALAAFFGHAETVKTLMEFGARPEAVTRAGASAHTWATARTFADVARCLDTPSPKTTPPQPRIQLQRNLSRRRFVTLGVIATFILIGCGTFGALVLRSSAAHDLPPPAPPPPQKIEITVTNPEPQLQPPAPEPVVNEAPPAVSRTENLVRPTVSVKKVAVPKREATSVSIVTEKPPEEEVKISEPIVVPKPRIESPKPAALSPQPIGTTKKAKVIQWP